jgi:RimJ/RimL family protein N-acetyltransferase
VTAHWPLADLVLRTPRLELRPDDDAGLVELADVALGGVHPPEEMPFVVPWTEADPRELGRRTLQHCWSRRAALAPERWTVDFLVRRDGRVVGMQGLTGQDFATTREVSTGSWLGRPHQGDGVGTEMRAAVLLFAVDHLGAVRARSSAFLGNAASLRVSEKLGYRADGTETVVRRGRSTADRRLVLDAADLVRPEWELAVEGVEEVLDLLDAAPADRAAG